MQMLRVVGRSIPMDVPDHFYRLTPVGSPVRTNSLRRSGRKASLQVAVDLSDTESAATSYDLLRLASVFFAPNTSIRPRPTVNLTHHMWWSVCLFFGLGERSEPSLSSLHGGPYTWVRPFLPVCFE